MTAQIKFKTAEVAGFDMTDLVKENISKTIKSWEQQHKQRTETMKQDKYFSQERMNLHKSMREIFAETPETDITAEDKQKALDRLDRMIIEEDAKPRANYHIFIDAHTENEDCVTIYHKTTDENPLSDHTTFYAWLHRNFPLIQWQFDDGDDTDEAENTDYCQYCCYTEPEGKGYILACYQVEETK